MIYSVLSSTFTVRYTAKLEDGTILEKKGFDGEDPLQFITDEGKLSRNFVNLAFLNHHNGHLGYLLLLSAFTRCRTSDFWVRPSSGNNDEGGAVNCDNTS